jgi:hypothetical protein
MQGIDQEPGIIPRAFQHLFWALGEAHKQNPKETLMVRCSYLEVYNEMVRDLLTSKPAPAGGLPCKEDVAAGRFFVKDLTDKVVDNEHQMAAVVTEGMARRAVGKTDMNAESSRSHSIFTVVSVGQGAKKSTQRQYTARSHEDLRIFVVRCISHLSFFLAELDSCTILVCSSITILSVSRW